MRARGPRQGEASPSLPTHLHVAGWPTLTRPSGTLSRRERVRRPEAGRWSLAAGRSSSGRVVARECVLHGRAVVRDGRCHVAGVGVEVVLWEVFLDPLL